MFINRKEELQLLEKEYKNTPSFSVIYGRRRVGKTALISEYIKNKPHLYLYATESSLKNQLQTFINEIITLFSLPYKISFNSFEEAFIFISQQNKKIILVIDEYQNLAKLDKSFSSMLQKVWDLYFSKSQIHLILCGSVISMMYSEVLSYNAPLYGRRTSNIHLKAIKFKYLPEFLGNVNKLDLMNVYASFGTIPKYPLMYDKDKNSFLYSEGYFLLKQEVNDTSNYFSILESISKGNTKIGSIASSIGVHSSYLPKYLNKLIELDIIQKEIPITETNPLKSKLGRYKIKDKFLNFWFYYVYKNYNYLELGQVDIVLDEIEKNFNDRFVSFAFEDYIFEEILYNPKKYLSFIPKKIGRWWNNKEEIDLVAFDDENIVFIECKWQNNVNIESIKNRLIQKSSLIKHNKKPFYLVITKKDYLK